MLGDDVGCPCADVLALAPVARVAARVEGPVPVCCALEVSLVGCTVLGFSVSLRDFAAAAAALSLAAA